MQPEVITFGTVATVGIKTDEHAYFVSGADGKSYFGRQKKRTNKLKKDDLVIFVASETRIVDDSISLIDEDATLFLSINLDSFLKLSSIWQHKIASRCEQSALNTWWKRQLPIAEKIPTLLLRVLGKRVAPDSDTDPLYLWAASTSPEVAHFLHNEAGHGAEALVHRMSAELPCPPLFDFPVDFVLDVYGHSSSFASAAGIARELLTRHDNNQALFIAEEFVTSANSDIRSVAIEWAQATEPPPESKCFPFSRIDHFLSFVRKLSLDERRPLLNQRLRIFPNDSKHFTSEEVWLTTTAPQIWNRDVNAAHQYLLLASEHATVEEIVAFLPILDSLSPFNNANNADSDTDLAIRRIGERFQENDEIPSWMKSYVTHQRPWSKMSDQQKMNVIIREHVQNPSVRTIPDHFSNESSLVKALAHFCNLAKNRGLNTQTLDVLQLLRDRLEAEWTTRSQSGSMIDNTPLLVRCTKPIISENVIHCEGRLHLERAQTDAGEITWIPVTPWQCRCPRTSDSCDQWNNLLPNTTKPWWRWSLNELLEQAEADYKAIGRRFIDDANAGLIYVNRLAGVANRVNELTDRLRCRGCNDRLTYQLKYAKNPAKYMTTLTNPCARSGPNCDGSVYINHCLGCGKIIDSRDSRFQVQERYNCIHCATADSIQNAGDWCPNCDTENSIFGAGQNQRCRACNHEVRLPASSRRARQQRTRWN